ncbi:hypothetical protein DE146DRAFT_626698 [Phaeosphaeria sp. MPI-PUGE-AT-0046c]|nr:hypothetical protein DE146DRAFT_626698 [Phaeosphaeria sp. MPI-PUGE-AT-0046c]
MEPFAIVGMAFRMPQEATDEDAFWNVLAHGKNLMTEWPESRVAVDAFYDDSGKANTLCGRGAHFTREDPAVFDAPFFAIPAREAAAMDPQHRWALEAAYHALENGGMTMEGVRGSRTAVYASSCTGEYALMQARDPDAAPRHGGIGTASTALANRVSWFFDLHGPSVHIDTACSSGLVALDMACQSIRSGDATAALVIGCNALLTTDSTAQLANMNFLSTDSKCHSFDARANGFGRGEGVVALVVKALAGALADGDMIRAVLRATASNQDGRTPTWTQPSAPAQESLIRHVYAKAGLALDDTRYFEAHGTGTVRGDPVEVTAIGRVFRPCRTSAAPLYVGSLKANVGHLEAASGLAAVVKCVLMLERGTIPPNALFETLNPDIDADFFNVQIPTRCLPWPSTGLRRVSINSFGFGGTNSHAVLDDSASYLQSHDLPGHHQVTNSTYRRVKAMESSTTSTSCELTGLAAGARLLVWSAADAASLQRMLHVYQDFYKRSIHHDADRLNRLCYTLATRRSVMSWRTFAVVSPPDDAAEDSSSNTDVATVLVTEQPRRASNETGTIAFVFTGQGAQYSGMGVELVRYQVFKYSVAKSDRYLARIGCHWSVLELLNDPLKIHNPSVSQPLCTVLQIALVDLLRSWDVMPAVVIGHSSGEIAAAYATGALSHESACVVAYHRGQVAEQARNASISDPGAMLSVNLTEREVLAHLSLLRTTEKETISVACINSASNLTLSGPSSHLDTLKEMLQKQEIFAQKVNTGVAYHSPAMHPFSDDYAKSMGHLQADSNNSTGIVMVSSVTACPVAADVLSQPQYWVENLLSPVRFAEALNCMADSSILRRLPLWTRPISDVIEIGPHATLRRSCKETVGHLNYHSALRRGQTPQTSILKVAGALFVHGHNVCILKSNGYSHDGSTSLLTDCPAYPFDHSKRYWSESRLSKDHRMRACTRGYLLGTPAHDWNPLQPRWRNWLSVESFPWLADHVVNETAVCPGTGMLVMAVEAVRQAVSTGRTISGFVIKDARFLAPILVRESLSEATETVVELRPTQNQFDRTVNCFQCVVYSSYDGKWKTCLTAEIQAQHARSSASENWTDETSQHHTQICNRVRSSMRGCSKSVDQHAFYSFCERIGVKYGPSFRLLRDIAWDGNKTSTARIDTTALENILDNSSRSVHPAVLDAAVHLLVAHVSQGLTQEVPTLVPSHFQRAWISAKSWDSDYSSLHLCTSTSATESDMAQDEENVYVMDESNNLLCSIQQLTNAEVSQRHSTIDDQRSRTLMHGISWKPQLSSLDAEQLQHLLLPHASNNKGTVSQSFYCKIETAVRLSAQRALQQLTVADCDSISGYMVKYKASLGTRCQPHDQLDIDDEALAHLLRECEIEQPEWRVFSHVAQALPAILRGEINPLEVLFNNQAAEDFYVFSFSNLAQDIRLWNFLDLASHEKPGLSILEVGAGTGSMSRSFLAAFKDLEHDTGQTRFGSYTYTDISPSFFEEARHRFRDFEDRMLFKTLDLNDKPLKQGFLDASYDLIVAGSVLHATSDLITTLSHLHKLLKPGGHLILLEVTDLESACANVAFGSLEGWWSASEHWRSDTPLVTEDRWDELLRESGFSGVEVLVKGDEEDTYHLTSVMISRALCTAKSEGGVVEKHQSQVVVIIDQASETQCRLAAGIEERHSETRVTSLERIGDPLEAICDSAVVISLLEVGCPILGRLNESMFSTLRSCIHKARNFLWVTCSEDCSEDSSEEATPPLSTATGFFRALRNEKNDTHFVTVSFETTGATIAPLLQVLKVCFLEVPQSTEIEFIVRAGHLHVGRIQKQVELDAERASRTHLRAVSEPWQPGPPLKLEVVTPGLLDTLRFIEDIQPPLRPRDIEIESNLWPLSFRDVFSSMGRLGKEKMGFECAGAVTRVGSDCTNEFNLGDQVLMISHGCMRTYPRAPADYVFKVPTNLSMVDAVAMLCPGVTAWYAFHYVARLQQGQKVLIHSAAGGTGQMAVKIAQMIGAEVFVTVGTEEKRQLAISPDGLNIPESHVFFSRDTSFASGIRRVTGGYGVDVVLNSLAGQSLRESWELVAPYGHFIEIGKSDIMANSMLPMGSFARNISFSSVDLLLLTMTNRTLTRTLVEEVLHFASIGKMQPPAPLHIYPVFKVEAAFRNMQSGKSTGRIVIRVDPSDIVSKTLKYKCSWQFDSKVSYLIAGGLGGVGRTILQWMVDRGARNIIVPSRSGPSSVAASDLISQLRSKRVNVIAPQCDITSRTELSNMLRGCSGMPPIRGCMNLAMVLNDAPYDSMTHKQWTQTIQTKIESSWNLHKLLPKDLDFFILTSSLCGIYGSLTQCNYAAGSSFLDALARLRTIQNDSCTSVSLDIGWMQSIGTIAEHSDYHRVRERVRDMMPIHTEDLLAILEHYCDPSLPPLAPEDSQVLIGISTPEDIRASGMNPPSHLQTPLFAPFDVVRPHASVVPTATSSSSYKDALQAFWQATDIKSKSAAVVRVLEHKLVHALGVQSEDLNVRKSFADYGVDSLMAIELRNLVWRDFRVSVAVFELMDGKDIISIGDYIAKKAE